MGYQALYRQWRPMKFADVTGQENVIRTLKNQIISGRTAHAYMFSGIRGTGKTTVAKIFARALNCLHPADGDPCGECEICRLGLNDANPDIMEIDAASNTGVDNVRDIIEKISYTPTVSKYKVFIIDEVHMLSKAAFNALLKTLEEPPAHAVFILATTDPQKVIPTVLSRCQRYEFRRMTEKQLTDRMRIILEGIGREADDDALNAIAEAADGGMRDAITLMDTCLSYTDGVLDEKTALTVIGSAGMDFVFELAGKILDFDIAGALTETDAALKNGFDASALMNEIAGHMRSLLIAKLAPGKLADILGTGESNVKRMCRQAESASQQTIMYMLDRFSQGVSDLKWSSSSRNMLELTIVRACTPENESSPEALNARLDELEKKQDSGEMAKRMDELEKKLADSTFTVKAESSDKKNAAAPVKNAAPVREAVPAGPDPDMLVKAIELVCADNPGLRNYASSLRFSRLDGDTMYVTLSAFDAMRKMMIENRASVFAEKLSEVYGREMHFVLENTAPQQKGGIPSKVRKELDQVFDVFGRENVDLTE